MADPEVDAVIDEVLGGDLDMQRREKIVDEVAYQYFSQIREEQGNQLDANDKHKLNMMVAISQADKDAILQRTNRVARRVLRPLGYKILQLQGLDPATADPATARAALNTALTPEQHAELHQEEQRLFQQVYLPEMQNAMEDIGIDTRDPDAVWHQFGEEVMGRAEEPPKQQSQTAPISIGFVAGAVVALGVSKLVRWLKQRRQQEHSEMYEEVSDSYADDASAYAE